jgi:hypothetical protein
MTATDHLSPAQFFHGSPDHYEAGHVIDPSQPHKSVWDVSSPSHAYFSDDSDDAADWGVQAARRTGRTRTNIYAVKPTGDYEHDPLGGYGAYRTTAGLQVLGHARDFETYTSDLSEALDSYWKNR